MGGDSGEDTQVHLPKVCRRTAASNPAITYLLKLSPATSTSTDSNPRFSLETSLYFMPLIQFSNSVICLACLELLPSLVSFVPRTSPSSPSSASFVK
ncbi:hypothetical protein JOB18_030892 [Solea senegalensis]|uniref:Uncharacterized protein n=1 Tax=Solea senegalensis TaxID=28829 RepID=A0AAV6RUM0_SOLSE|nr:hypothetical protein JOB18_030892 [Solea senegalensis]